MGEKLLLQCDISYRCGSDQVQMTVLMILEGT